MTIKDMQTFQKNREYLKSLSPQEMDLFLDNTIFSLCTLLKDRGFSLDEGIEILSTAKDLLTKEQFKYEKIDNLN